MQDNARGCTISESREEVGRLTCKPVDAWWTVVVIDPIAISILPFLRRRSFVTPNGLTAVAFVLGCLSCVAFLDGPLWLGAVLFEVRFLLDCLDGKLARLTGKSSPIGALLDLAADVVSTTAVFACLGIRLVTDPSTPIRIPEHLALSVAVLFLLYYWFLSWAKQLQSESALATDAGSSRGLWGTRLASKPRSVDIEAATLFLAPLTGSFVVAAAALFGAGVYYAVGAADYLRRAVRAVTGRET